MLYIDINIKTGTPPIRLPVFKGDTADDLASLFCIQNGIGPEIEKQLVGIFEDKMSIIKRDNEDKTKDSSIVDYIPRLE